MKAFTKAVLNLLRRFDDDPRLSELAGVWASLLTNSSFEDQSKDEAGNLVVPGWHTLWSGDDVIREELVKVHSGSKAVAITRVNGTFDTIFYSGGQPDCPCIEFVRVFPDEDVLYEFWVMGAPGRYAILNGSNDTFIVPITPIGEFQEYTRISGSFRVPNFCYHVRIMFYAPPAAGAMYLDDVVMKVMT